MTTYDEFIYVEFNRCDVPCCCDPFCRMWVETRDKFKDADRRITKSLLANAKDCPLWNIQRDNKD